MIFEFLIEFICFIVIIFLICSKCFLFAPKFKFNFTSIVFFFNIKSKHLKDCIKTACYCYQERKEATIKAKTDRMKLPKWLPKGVTDWAWNNSWSPGWDGATQSVWSRSIIRLYETDQRITQYSLPYNGRFDRCTLFNALPCSFFFLFRPYQLHGTEKAWINSRVPCQGSPLENSFPPCFPTVWSDLTLKRLTPRDLKQFLN